MPIRASSCLEEVGLERCRTLLDEDPENFPIRLAICDGMVAAGNPQAARGLMESATRVHKRTSTQRLISRAVDNVNEHINFLEQGEEITDPKVFEDHLRFRCTKLKSEDDCRDLLVIRPGEAEPNIILGDLALEAGTAAEAVAYFLAAADSEPARVNAKLEQALEDRREALAPCFSGSGRESLSTCENNLISGHEDERQIRLRIGDIHLLARRYGNARHAYGHASTGSSGQDRAALVTAIEDCTGTSTTPCNQALERARDNRVFTPLLAAVYKNRCVAALSKDNDVEITQFCEDALDRMSTADASEIQLALDNRSVEMTVDPWEEIAQSCTENAASAGWNSEPCRSVADAAVSPELVEVRDLIRSELDTLEVDACREAIAREPLDRARIACDQNMQQAYLAETRTLLDELLATAESAQASDTSSPIPIESADDEPPQTDIDVADVEPPPPVPPGNNPRGGVEGVFVVTY